MHIGTTSSGGESEASSPRQELQLGRSETTRFLIHQALCHLMLKPDYSGKHHFSCVWAWQVEWQNCQKEEGFGRLSVVIDKELLVHNHAPADLLSG